jgi:thioredoxin 1
MFKDLGPKDKPSENFSNLGIGSSKSDRPSRKQVERYRDTTETGTFPGGPPQNAPPSTYHQQKTIPSGGSSKQQGSDHKFAVSVKDIDHKIDLINTHKIAVLDIWAPWCNPCLMIADKYEDMAKKYNRRGVCLLGKENLEDKIQQPEGVNIKGIPTFLFFKDGVHIDTTVGADLNEVEAKLQELLNEV